MGRKFTKIFDVKVLYAIYSIYINQSNTVKQKRKVKYNAFVNK